MGLESVIDRILRDSRKAEADIIAAAEAEARSILEEAEQRKAEVMARYRKRAEEMVASTDARERARTEVEANKVLLGVRRDILAGVLEGALARLKALPDTEKAKLYGALLDEARKSVSSGTVHCPAGEEALFRDVHGFRVVPGLDAAGGFMVESADGTVVMDFRFEELLEDIWQDVLPRVHRLLFPGPGGMEAE